MAKKTLLTAVVTKVLIRMVATAIIVVLLLGLTLSIRSIWVQSDTATKAAENLGQGTAFTLASMVLAPLEFEDTAALARILKEMRLISNDISYLAVVRKNGTMVQAIPEGTQLAPMVVTNRDDKPIDINVKDIPIRDFVALAKASTETFSVHVGIDKSNVNDQISSIRTWNILLTLILAILATVMIGFAAKRIIQQVSSLSEHVAGSVQELRAAATEILAIAGQTETNSESQAASVDETRRTMQALIEAAADIADGASNVVIAAERSSEASVVIAERIAKLNTQATAISDLSESIRGIADKSDILALNASLEGTKAGEAGRGFVLLGAEMRRLAETITDTVRRIKSLAGEIRELSQSAVLASEEGQKLASETTETAKRITLVTNQQRTSTEQVKQAMDEVQQFSQQAVSGARQARSTADDLVHTAGTLSTMLEQEQSENQKETTNNKQS
ncbi:MAG: hypothetical protein JW841_08960 [Deltaproteobacteria bacterium]|nr:hypothetical protein [Deltaproteobacteria bacterium]